MFWLVTGCCLAFSACYELLEMALVLVCYPASGPEWLGMQGDPWDAHADIQAHRRNAKNSDQPFAAVIKDLKGLKLGITGRGASSARPLPAHSMVTRWVTRGRARSAARSSRAGCRTAPPSYSTKPSGSSSGMS